MAGGGARTSTLIIVRMARLDASGPTGTFVDADGAVPW